LSHGHHYGEVSFVSSIGVVSGWVAKLYATAVLTAPPWWFGTLLQALVTIIVGAIAVLITHFLKRWLKRRWPEDSSAAKED